MLLIGSLFCYFMTAVLSAGVKPRIQYHEGPSVDCQNIPTNQFPRYRRAVPPFDDPMYSTQWYLTDPSKNMNIMKAWENGYTGKDIVVSVVDTGLEYTHDEFKQRYDQDASYDFVQNDPLPDPVGGTSANHGTKVAGIIGARANNKKCGVGVAHDAKIGGIRFIDSTGGTVSGGKDVSQDKALSYKRNYIDIYACAWGPDDTIGVKIGYNLVPKTFKDGATLGRNSKGSIYVFAAGNEGPFGDSCTYDGYVNSIYTIALSNVNPDGSKSLTSERCPSIMAVTYTRDGNQGVESVAYPMPTADIGNKCSNSFSASSAATAVGSGIFALTLQANKDLTWRDLQHLITKTSDNDPAKVIDNLGGWHTNGAGYNVSDTYGFGILDAMALINMAKIWQRVPDQITCEYQTSDSNRPIQQSVSLTDNINFSSFGSCGIKYLEHVELILDLSFKPLQFLQVELKSPSSLVSYMILPRRFPSVTSNMSMFSTMSLHHWGEDPSGLWTLTFNNSKPATTGNGTLRAYKLIFYGTSTKVTTPTPGPSTTTGSTSAGSTKAMITTTTKTVLVTSTPKSHASVLAGASKLVVACIVLLFSVGFMES